MDEDIPTSSKKSRRKSSGLSRHVEITAMPEFPVDADLVDKVKGGIAPIGIMSVAQKPVSPALTMAAAVSPPATSSSSSSISTSFANISNPGFLFDKVDSLMKAKFSQGKEVERHARDHLVERLNLLNMVKLSTKRLIESTDGGRHTVNDKATALQQFCAVMEHVMEFGLRVKRNILGVRRGFWGYVQVGIGEEEKSFGPLIRSIRHMSGVTSNLGRGRAWIRMTLMAKSLESQLAVLVNARELTAEWYEDWALLRNGDDANMIVGLLVGLNPFDFNLVLRGDDLDATESSVIDLASFFKDGNYKIDNCLSGGDDTEETVRSTDDSSKSLLEQKAYLEELNRNLVSQVSELSVRTAQLSQMDALKVDNEQLNSKYNSLQQNMLTEKRTLRASNAAINDMYIVMKKQMETERKLRLEYEAELLAVRARCCEANSLSKEHQDTSATLRKQLEDIKRINLQVLVDLQEARNRNKEMESNAVDSSSVAGKYIVPSEGGTAEQQDPIITSADMERIVAETLEERRAKERAEELLATVESKLELEVELRQRIEKDLAMEREWRATMQRDVGSLEKRATAALQKAADRDGLKTALEQTQEELHKAQTDLAAAQRRSAEQELTLVEMGTKLSIEQERMDSLIQFKETVKNQAWTDDKQITNCHGCMLEFTLSRRKHHCRNCGHVYCNECSSGRQPLPSSPHPVRVCDQCEKMLLLKYNV